MTSEMGIRATMKTSFEDAIERTTAALKAEGFGVLTRIDVRATFREKLNAEFRPYVILGACNPPLAHRALSANAEVGLLLPCNVTVEDDGEQIVVTAINPEQMLSAMKTDAVVQAVAGEAKAKLERAISSLKT
jgi:uncharacterized protein (DUF302 family)